MDDCETLRLFNTFTFTIVQHSPCTGSGKTKCVNVTEGNTTAVYPQQVPPLYSVQVFYLLMTAWLIVATAAFAYLHFYSKTAKVKGSRLLLMHSPFQASPSSDSLTSSMGENEDLDNNKRLSTRTYMHLLTECAWVSVLQNAIIPSFMTYAFIPYSLTVYHWGLIVFNIANPVACFVQGYWRSSSKNWLLGTISSIGTAAAAYVVALAALSPHPFGLFVTDFDWRGR